MPLYEFRCEECGEFEAWRTLAEFDAPMKCPVCETVARRIICAPYINLNSGSLSLQGKKSSEPRLVTQKKQPTIPRYQSSRGDRPWMVSHAPPR